MTTCLLTRTAPWTKDEGNDGIGCPPAGGYFAEMIVSDSPGKWHESGINTGQIYEIFAVTNIAGGTMVIPIPVGSLNIGKN